MFVPLALEVVGPSFLCPSGLDAQVLLDKPIDLSLAGFDHRALDHGIFAKFVSAAEALDDVLIFGRIAVVDADCVPAVFAAECDPVS